MLSEASWSTSSDGYSFGPPAPGTGIAASCNNESVLADGSPDIVVSELTLIAISTFQNSPKYVKPRFR